jgi:undecaprenyl diphosphate synthase
MTKENRTERKIPNHIAIIMDGNGRWAQEKGMHIKKGHIEGVNALGRTIEACIELGIKNLTVWAFSTENWNRSKREVTDLMTLTKFHIKKQANELNEKGVKIKVLGSFDKVENTLVKQINYVEKLTEDNNKLNLNVCFSYGGRQEIIDTTKKIAKKVLDGVISIDDIDEKVIKENLYNPEMPELDLLIRTSGELRFSGFLPWHLHYAEFYFPKTYWPDFGKESLIEAIDSFNNRERRYGKRNY